ncbi:MAG TPA: hypothetical protein EYP19_14490 [Desulfobacterales bacterium]|nr:hypothetical protein [Desulfobacterales bacterium]
MGKAVSSAATSEIVDCGGVALWATEADNRASIKIAEALGYKRIFCYIRIPKSAIEENAGKRGG